MPNVEWSVPHRLVSPTGTILLNQLVPVGTTSGAAYLWQIEPDGYKMVPSVRVLQDNKSQGDGSVLHPRYLTGVVATMKVSYMFCPTGALPDVEPACGADLRYMNEQMGLVVNALRNYDQDTGSNMRLYWTPTGYGDERMLDEIELLQWPDPGLEGLFTQVTFSLETPFPYAIDKTQTTSGGGTITNAGNANFYPVIQVGASGNFQIKNNSVLDRDGNPLSLYFNSSLPGGVASTGAEINTFKGTIFQGGAGADLIASIDPQLSDFFYLKPGANSISVSGVSATFLLNNAWI